MNEIRTIKIKGKYVPGWNSASDNWQEDIIANQENVFPEIHKMHKGTFNIKLKDPANYEPSDIGIIRLTNGDRSCISKIAKVTRINNIPIEAWIYDGGWPNDTLELISEINISKTLNLKFEDEIQIQIDEKTI